MCARPQTTLHVTRSIEAPAERVFDAWLDPERARSWLFATPTGRMVRADIDPRVGGSYCFVERREGEDFEHMGEYLEISRPRRLSFTLRVPQFAADPTHATRVTVDIAPSGNGCELTLTQEDVLAEFARRTEAGWATVLDGLAASVSLKEAAVRFLRLVASGSVREAYHAHVGRGFRHHNAFFRGDAESLMAAQEENAVQNPDKVLEVQRALEDGDLVAVHSRVRQKPGDRGTAVVHLFRFEGDRVVELWDVGQPVPEDSPNDNGMF